MARTFLSDIVKNKLYFVYLLSTFLIFLHITILTKCLEKLALSRYIFFFFFFWGGSVLRCRALGEGGLGLGAGEVGVVNRCMTEGSNYQVTIICLINLYLTVDRRKVTKVLDTNK